MNKFERVILSFVSSVMVSAILLLGLFVLQYNLIGITPAVSADDSLLIGNYHISISSLGVLLWRGVAMALCGGIVYFILLNSFLRVIKIRFLGYFLSSALPLMFVLYLRIDTFKTPDASFASFVDVTKYTIGVKHVREACQTDDAIFGINWNCELQTHLTIDCSDDEIRDHKNEILADYRSVKPLVEWVREVNEHADFSDYCYSFRDPHLNYKPFKIYGMSMFLYARLVALEGNVDQCISISHDLLGLAHRFKRGSNVLLHI